MPRAPLPIDDVLPELIAALRHAPNVVLRAPAGAGKTTRVPQAVLESGLAGERRILVLQPRRLAARAAARRIAWERRTRVGDEVGYQVRFDRQSGPRTRIEVLTEGILVRMLQQDPFLENAGVVVFDEFHERNLDSDLSLAMVRRVQQTVRPDLKIVVMSATLDAAPIAAYLGQCPTVESLGRTFPVEIGYASHRDERALHVLAAEGVSRLLSATGGDLLVFLPGQREIRQTAKQLEQLAGAHELAVMPLYGDLPMEQQDAVLVKGERRKVVLATNVAETSVTIEGITGVVDSGLARTLQFDPRVGLDRLRLLPISKASADQRAGRAGRTTPGMCLRLWTEASQRSRPEHETPEIRRVDLAGPVLQLLCWGEREIAGFPWFEPPREESLERARQLLQRLDAVAGEQVTELGRTIARFPVHPRIGSLLVEGHRLGIPERAALAAALLSERDPFTREADAALAGRTDRERTESDVLNRLRALEAWENRNAADAAITRGRAKFVLRARDQLLRLLRQELGDAQHEADDPDEALLRALLAAFPDRLARRRGPHDPRGVMAGGRGVRLARESAVHRVELFLCINIDAAAGEALVRQASAVQREWLPSEHLRTAVELEFDDVQGRVLAWRRTRWEDLVLDEAATSASDDEQTARLLAAAAADRLDAVFPRDDPAVQGFLDRVRSLAAWMPELGLPPLEDGQLRELLPMLCAGCRSFAELRKAPWLAALKSLLTASQLQAVEREAPERIAVPSGSRIALQYEPGRAPVLAVRIQEVFGLRETPRIAAGRVPVLLHLLAPNMRPQQVTDDLKSFWQNTYPQVRKELRRRYPKHAWPEDPSTAPPQRRPPRRRD